VGSAWSSSISSGTCAVNSTASGSTTVCRGDTLFTRYQLNNGSTGGIDVVQQLYLSTDEQLATGSDLLSPSWTVSSVPVGRSARRSVAFEVPAVSRGVVYHPILKVVAYEDTDGAPSAGTMRTDWIPLRGTVTGC
jgi:hypothetical protein